MIFSQKWYFILIFFLCSGLSHKVYAEKSNRDFSKLEIIDLQHVLTDTGVKNIEADLEQIFAFDIEVYRQEIDLEQAYDNDRRQYHAQTLLKLDDIREEPNIYKIYLIKNDMYGDRKNGKKYNYLFAWTDFERRLTVMSLRRLFMTETRDRRSIEAMIDSRITKLVMRRVGLMNGLSAKNGCVMKFSDSLQELDNMHPTYCNKDKEKLIKKGVLRQLPKHAPVPG